MVNSYEYLGISQTQVPKSSSIYTKLAINYLEKDFLKLKIDEDYLEAFSTIIEGLYDTDISGYDNKIRVSNTKKVRVKFIISCIRLAKKLDLIHITSNTFLYNDTLPHLIESRKEWEEFDKAKFLNFSNSCITINATCNEQNIYNALKKWILEIDELIKNNIKTLLSVDDDTFPIKSIIDNVHSENLPNKTNVGISIHKENIVKAFIGQIYENPKNNRAQKRPDNKFIAIREIIQNAIDACIFKKLNQKTENYQPKITVILEDDYLVVQDNGIGMNIFVVENYFAKLGHSYYQHHLETKNNEIIAQFGVGVFSYLKIADYIDVETVKTGQKPLKFRIDNDVNTNFYFYENTTLQEGTIIRLKLKDEIKNELTSDLLTQIIKFFFRFVDVDIFVANEGTYKIQKDTFNLNVQKTVINNIKLKYKNQLQYEIVYLTQNHEKYDGAIGIILPFVYKEKEKVYVLNFNLSQLFKDHTYNSLIEVSHKGVFINNFHSDIFGQVVGKINLKTTQKLNFRRDEFIDKSFLENAILNISKSLIFELFKKFSSNIISIYTLTNWFILNYGRNNKINSDLETLYQNLFHCKLLKEDDFVFEPLKTVLNNDIFNIISLPLSVKEDNHDYHIEYFQNINKNFQQPILITTRKTFSFFHSFVLHKKYELIVKSEDALSYLIVETNSNKGKTQKVENLNVLPFIGEHFLTVFDSSKNSTIPTVFINSKHRVFKFYQEKINNEETKKIMTEFFRTTNSEFVMSRLNNDNYSMIILNIISSLNRILNELKEPEILLTKDDFPKWLLEMK